MIYTLNTCLLYLIFCRLDWKLKVLMRRAKQLLQTVVRMAENKLNVSLSRLEIDSFNAEGKN